MNLNKYAAIDIGSNGVRLLISTLHIPNNKPFKCKKTSLVRVPIRLGTEVFTEGKISLETQEKLVKAMQSFKNLMDIHGVCKYRACATSAMRCANNKQEIQNAILKNTGIQIDIIDGKEEAHILSRTDLKDLLSKDDKTYLYIDVGGGSTEFTIFEKGKAMASKSFQMGTVRLLNELTSDETWTEAKNWLQEHTKDYKDIALIGSGGNINSIMKRIGKRPNKMLIYSEIKDYETLLNNMSYHERIWELNLNPDRADVIIHATKIYLSAMEWVKAEEIFVPKIGLTDGIIRCLVETDLNCATY